MKLNYAEMFNYGKPKITFKQVLIVFLVFTICVSMQSAIESFSLIYTERHYSEYLRQLEVKKNTEGFDSLLEINPNIMAWITIDDIGLSLPIVKTTSKQDEDFYLNHGVDNKKNALGCPYQPHDFDLANNNSMFIGHSSYNFSLFNSTTNQSLFGKLNRYIDETRSSFNYNIKLETSSGIATYHIAGLFKFKITDTTDTKYTEVYSNIFNQNNLDTQAKFDSFMSTLEKYSKFSGSIDASFGDKILTLFTCYYNLDYRTIIVATQIS